MVSDSMVSVLGGWSQIQRLKAIHVTGTQSETARGEDGQVGGLVPSRTWKPS